MAEKRLIDKEALDKVIEFYQAGYSPTESRGNALMFNALSAVRKMVADAPTVEAVEVIHAEWINASSPDEDDNIDFNCSNCGAGEKHAKGFHVPYCWKCVA